MDLVVALGLFFALALALPLVRHRLRTGEWGIVVHREADPFQRFVGTGFGLTLLGLAVWGGAYALLGPEALCVGQPAPWARAMGWSIYGLSLLLVMAAQATMGASWRIGIDDRRTVLVARGVYRAARHPIYTGMMGLVLSLILLAPSPWTALAFPLVAFQIGVQARLEEMHLEKLHGEAWKDYAARTGRFLPRFRVAAPPSA
jgi:protein-S-isoprenylcysteine O-methyltransferase Ste14